MGEGVVVRRVVWCVVRVRARDRRVVCSVCRLVCRSVCRSAVCRSVVCRSVCLSACLSACRFESLAVPKTMCVFVTIP